MASTFTIDDPVVSAYLVDLVWPLTLTPTNDLQTVSGLENLRRACETRAITRLGEVPHRPDDGINFDEFQNAPSVLEEYAALQARLLEQYPRDPRIESASVDVLADSSNNGDVYVVCHIVARTGDSFSDPVPLVPGAT